MAELKITKNNFENEVIKSELPVLLDFWASWCGPCRMLAPAVESIAEKYDGKAKVGKINVDEESELAAAFEITSIPTIIIIKNGMAVSKAAGYMPEAQLEDMLKAEL